MSKELFVGRNQMRGELLASEYLSLIHNTNSLILRFGYDELVAKTIRKMADYLTIVANNLEHKNNDKI